LRRGVVFIFLPLELIILSRQKINRENSWKLNLIDYMDDVLHSHHQEGDLTNFQAASCTLEASTKIYSCRVDSVHEDTFKILGGLTRTEKGFIMHTYRMNYICTAI